MEAEKSDNPPQLPIDWELRVLGFEHRLRQLNNRRVEAVFYCEVNYASKGAAWNYRPGYDSLDFGLALELDNGAQFIIQWGALFTQYCLSLEPSHHWTGQKIWNVTLTSRWKELLNVEVIDTQLFWKETDEQDLADYSHYPQDIGLTFANGKQVYISAFEIREDNFSRGCMDHITVFFDQETARKYRIGPWGVAG